MTEWDAAKLIASGELPSPYKHANITLWAVKVTGTGMSYRDSLDEYVWRDPGIFLSEEFIQRVSGLPLVWEHPKAALDSDEFNDRVIGSLMFGYAKDDELWGVARVYDDAAIELMSENQLSTSPGVVFRESDGNNTIKAPDGKPLLIEGNPYTLCHLAVVENGVWDKGGPPDGVQNDLLSILNQEPGSMAEQQKDAVAADARQDSSIDRMDAILDALKKMDERNDATFKRLDARMDAMETKDSARADASLKAEAKRADAEASRKDAEEDKEKKDMKSDSEDKEEEDKEKKDSEDKDKDKDEDEKKDSWGDDDDEDEDKKKKKEDKKDAKESKDTKKDAGKKSASRKDSDDDDDDDEKKKKDSRKDARDTRNDAAMSRENDELRQLVKDLSAKVSAVTREVTPKERDALAAAQIRADAALAMLGDRAPPPISGESSLSYRRRMLNRLKAHSEEFKETRFDGLDTSTLSLVEDKVYADAINGARNTMEATSGTLVPYESRDAAGRLITRYHGDIGAFLQPFVPTGVHTVRGNRRPNAGA